MKSVSVNTFAGCATNSTSKVCREGNLNTCLAYAKTYGGQPMFCPSHTGLVSIHRIPNHEPEIEARYNRHLFRLRYYAPYTSNLILIFCYNSTSAK